MNLKGGSVILAHPVYISIFKTNANLMRASNYFKLRVVIDNK